MTPPVHSQQASPKSGKVIQEKLTRKKKNKNKNKTLASNYISTNDRYPKDLALKQLHQKLVH